MEKQSLLSASHHGHGGGSIFAPLALAGEAMWEIASSLSRLSDGSMILVQTDRASYHAGEMLTGRVIAYIQSPVQAESVALKVKLKEKTVFDEERSNTVFERKDDGTSEAITTWHHDIKTGKRDIFKTIVIVSQIPHVLPPGTYSYPFAVPLPASLPGVAKFRKVRDSQDPHWRRANRRLETLASVAFTIKAVLQKGGFFHRELRSVQEIPVNPFFDWSKMVPAMASGTRDVRVCCFFDKGPCSVSAVMNKAAFQSGETVLVTATFKNDSTVELRTVQSRLYRHVTVSDGRGHQRRFTDIVCEAHFQGVPPQSTCIREMPLRLVSGHGPLQASINSQLLSIRYSFDIVGSIAWASDLDIALPVVIYEPSPATYGVQAMMPLHSLPPQVVTLLSTPSPAPAATVPMQQAPMMPMMQQPPPQSPMPMPMSPQVAMVSPSPAPSAPLPSAPAVM